MSVDRVDSTPSFEQSQKLVQRHREIEDQELALSRDKMRLEHERQKVLSEGEEKNDQTRVTISREGEKQSEQLRKANAGRLAALSDNQQQNFQVVADKTSEQIRALDAESVKKISDFRVGAMERFNFVAKQSEDPFYHLKSLNPMTSESDQDYQIKLALPEHEAKNLFVASDDKRTVKLSLARSFQDMEDTAPNAKTRTSNYQTILETLTMPGIFDSKRIRREYADGVLTVILPKV